MSRKFLHLLTDEVVQAAARQYDLDVSRLVNLGSGNVNVVYEYQHAERPYILRVTHNSRRQLSELLAEADFVHYLREQGASVASALPAMDGSLAVSLPHGFLAVLFEKAPGRLPEESDWGDDFAHRWGRLTGSLHRIARAYQPPADQKRRAWQDEDWLDFTRFIPADQTAVLRHADALVEQLRRLPQDVDSYGLIHNDLHGRNFLIDQGTLTAFDFDDCCYNWYVNDIANILYHELTRFGRPPRCSAEAKVYGEHFLRSFLAGYRTEIEIDSAWLARIPHLMKLRRLLLYVFYHQEFDLNNLSDLMQTRIRDTRRSIEEDTPLTDICFESL